MVSEVEPQGKLIVSRLVAAGAELGEDYPDF